LDRIKVTNDLVFKAIFGRQEHEKLLLALLNALFESTGDERIDSLQILNPISVNDLYNDKTIVLDIKATDRNDRIIHIEVQLGNLSWFIDRFVYYNAKTISEQLKDGEPYGSINRVISIAIIGEGKILPAETSVHNIYWYINNKTGNVLTRLTEIHFIELDKFNAEKNYIEMTRFEKWLHFLKLGDLIVNKELPEIREMETEEEIKMALKYYKEYTADDKLIDMIEARKKAQRDEHARMHFAIEQAKEQARAEGEANGEARGEAKSKVEIARNMLKLGVDKEIILKTTGLSSKDLDKIE